MEREEPEIAVVLSITYRGRRLESLRQLAERISVSGRMTTGWTADDVCAALEVLTGIEAFEVLTARPGRTASDAARALFSMARAFFVEDGSAGAGADLVSRVMPKPILPVTGNPEADELLVTDPLALPTGMLLDQQVH